MFTIITKLLDLLRRCSVKSVRGVTLNLHKRTPGHNLGTVQLLELLGETGRCYISFINGPQDGILWVVQLLSLLDYRLLHLIWINGHLSEILGTIQLLAPSEVFSEVDIIHNLHIFFKVIDRST